MSTVYIFQDGFLGRDGQAYVCIGDSSFVGNFFGVREIAEIFKREICYISDEDDRQFLGVYGKRRCSRFR